MSSTLVECWKGRPKNSNLSDSSTSPTILFNLREKIATCSFSKIKCGSPDLKHLQKFICFSTRWLSQECEGAADWFVSGFSLIADCLLPSPFFGVSHAKETGVVWGQGHAQDMCDLRSIVWIPQITRSCSGQMHEKLQVSGSRLWVFSCPSSSLPTLVSLTVFTN